MIFNRIYVMMILLIAIFSCQEKYPTYDYPYDRLGFVYDKDVFGTTVVDSVKKYTFVYQNSEVVRDTLWIEMATSGHIKDYDRSFEIEQVASSKGKNAVPGVHYVSFDDEELLQMMHVSSGANKALLPIVVLRDVSLQEDPVYLRIKLKENNFFNESFLPDRYYTVEITDQLVMPATWEIAEYYFAGTYGPKKLRFMIDFAGKWTIDDEWFDDNFKDYSNVDMGYTSYLSNYYTNKLIEHNTERKNKGLDVLKEDVGTIVQFFSYGTPQPYI